MESQGTQNNQNNFENKEQSWRTHIPWFQNLLQKNNHQNCMVLAEGQKCRQMERNRESKNKPLHSLLNFNKVAKTIQWEKDSIFNEWC